MQRGIGKAGGEVLSDILTNAGKIIKNFLLKLNLWYNLV